MACYANIVSFSVGMVLMLSGCGDSKGQLSAGSVNSPRAQSMLAEMNEHGLIPHEGRSYQYAINIACQLEITTKLNDSLAGVMAIDLATTQLERFDFARSLGYAVRSATDVAHPNLFTAISDVKADRIFDLMKALRKDCSGSD